MSTAVALIFTIFFDIFYIFFAIRFINYAQRFHIIEDAMEISPAEETALPEAEETIVPNGKTADLEQRLAEWVAAKGYTERNVTVDMLATKFYTNRDYLSKHINAAKGRHFNRWVNELRIVEAQRLMREYPDMSVGEIASKTGFVNSSHFGKVFLALTKSTPKVWRNSPAAKDFVK